MNLNNEINNLLKLFTYFSNNDENILSDIADYQIIIQLNKSKF